MADEEHRTTSANAVASESTPDRPSQLDVALGGRGVRSVLLVAALSLAGMGIHAAAPVLVPVIFGLLFAAAAQPLVARAEQAGLPTPLALFVGLLAMFLVMTAATATMVFGAVDFVQELPKYSAELLQLKNRLVRLLYASRLFGVGSWAQGLSLEWQGEAAAAQVLAAGKTLGFAALTGLVAFFGLIERESFPLRLAGESAESQHTWSLVLRDTQRYLAVKTIASAATGVGAALVCFAAGVPNAALWGAIAFWANFIPVVGSLLAAIPPVLMAMAVGSDMNGLGVGMGYLVINMVIGNFLEPRWHGQAAGLSPLVVILSIALWSGLLGFMGAILAVPLTMVLKIGCFHTGDLAWVARLLDEKPPRKEPPPSSPREPVESPDKTDRPSLFS